MIHMKTSIKRILALILSVLMVLQLMPGVVLAETLTEESTSDDSLNSEWITITPSADNQADTVSDESSADTGDVEEVAPMDELPADGDEGLEPEEPTELADSAEVDSVETIDSPEDAPEPDPVEQEVWEEDEELPADTEIILDDPEYFEPAAELTEEEEVELLYDGSWIKYAIYTNGHTYVLTNGTTHVYDDSGLGADHLIGTLPSEYTPLLATEHYQRGNTRGVTVWFITQDGEAQSGYVRESDLVNAYYTDEEAGTWTEYTDYRELDFGSETLLAFLINEWSDEAAQTDVEEQTSEPEPMPEDTITELVEEIDQQEPSEQTTETVDPEEVVEEPVESAEPIRAVALKSGAFSYGTLRADSEMPVPITTRPRAYIFANRRGYISINSADGGVFTTYNNTYGVGSSIVTVLGYTRYHHALVKVEWYDTENSTTRILLVEAAYMKPIDKTYETKVVDSAGNIYPNWDVNVYDGKGDYVTTVQSDANGVARYTGLHLNVASMLRYAELHYEETDTNVLIEDNDCATFVSECLTEGGFTVYGAYASNNPDGPYSYGYGLYDRLKWLGVPGTSDIDITKLSPGDVVFMHRKSSTTSPYGHSMIIGDVNIETGQVLLYGHSSTNKDANQSNKMWIDISALCYVAYTSIYDYSFDYELPTQILVIKRDADTWAELAGAVIDLYKDGQLIETHTTTSDGRVLFSNLEPGEYIVKERYAPEGYGLARRRSNEWQGNVLMARVQSEDVMTGMAGKPGSTMKREHVILSMERHRLKSGSVLRRQSRKHRKKAIWKMRT